MFHIYIYILCISLHYNLQDMYLCILFSYSTYTGIELLMYKDMIALASQSWSIHRSMLQCSIFRTNTLVWRCSIFNWRSPTHVCLLIWRDSFLSLNSYITRYLNQSQVLAWKKDPKWLQSQKLDQFQALLFFSNFHWTGVYSSKTNKYSFRQCQKKLGFSLRGRKSLSHFHDEYLQPERAIELYPLGSTTISNISYYNH